MLGATRFRGIFLRGRHALLNCVPASLSWARESSSAYSSQGHVTHYMLLKVKATASTADIKAAFRKVPCAVCLNACVTTAKNNMTGERLTEF